MHAGYQRYAGLCLGRRPCTTSRGLVQGRSQGTTLTASDLHNATETILIPSCNMKCKIIKKIWQNYTRIKADIPCVNVTLNWYNALASDITYVSDDVNCNTKNLTVSAREWDWKRFEINGSAVEHNFIFSCTRAKPGLFDSVYITGNQIKLFQ